VATRAEALRVKLACHQLEAGGQPRLHLAYWLGLTLRPQIPALGVGLHTEIVPPLFQSLGRSLLEAFGLDCVEVGALGAVTSARLYKELTATLPPPKIEFKLPGLHWHFVWSGLAMTGLPPPFWLMLVSQPFIIFSPFNPVAIAFALPPPQLASDVEPPRRTSSIFSHSVLGLQICGRSLPWPPHVP
jgi:hypothetical protein